MGYKRRKLKDGEVVEVSKVRGGMFVQYVSCCDCGLTHLLQHQFVGGKLLVAAWRDNRTTAALRRHRKYKWPR